MISDLQSRFQIKNPRSYIINQVRGFTLLELLLAVAIIVGLGFLSAPVYIQYQTNNDLLLARDIAAQSFRRAQLYAQGSKGDSGWGVYVGSGLLTVFRGSSYATRDTGFDEVYDISSALSVSGDTEVIFDSVTGETASGGLITFTSPYNQSATVVFNEKGAVY